jgi:amino acid adenylation domain-containing protein
MSLSALLFDAASRHTSHFALHIADERTSYADLTRSALHIAARLRALGAEREAVGIVGQRKQGSYAGVLGIVYAACHYVPLKAKAPPDKTIALLRAANIRFLVGDEEDLRQMQAQLQTLGQGDGIVAYIAPDSECAGAEGNDWRRFDADSIAPLAEPLACEANDLAYILFTSGSSGTPKGVKVSQANVLAYLRAIHRMWDLQPGYRASQFHDFSFDPSVSDLFTTWSLGGELCVVPEAELIAPAHFIRRSNLQVWSSVPSIGTLMHKLGMLKADSFPTLRISRFAGEPLPRRMAQAWQAAAPASTVENHYGPTEATIDVARHIYLPMEADLPFANDIVPIGSAFAGMDICILDEQRQPVPQGVIGQIAFKGPQLSQGYLNDPDKTHAVFVHLDWDVSGDIWYLSGDAGFVNPQGHIECLGRMDSQIKVAGRRVEIGEIEAALARFTSLSDVVVVAVKDAQGLVTELVGFTAGQVSAQDLADIKKASARTLDAVFFPRRIVALAQLPYAVSGKVDRRALLEMARASAAKV